MTNELDTLRNIYSLVDRAEQGDRQASEGLRVSLGNYRSTLPGLALEAIRDYDEALAQQTMRKPPSVETRMEEPLYFAVMNYLVLLLNQVHGMNPNIDLAAVSRIQEIRTQDRMADTPFVEDEFVGFLIDRKVWVDLEKSLHKDLIEGTAAWLEGARAKNRLAPVTKVEDARRLGDGQILMGLLRLKQAGQPITSPESIVRKLKTDGYFNSRQGVLPDVVFEIYRELALTSSEWPVWVRITGLWLGSWVRANTRTTYLGYKRNRGFFGLAFWLLIMAIPVLCVFGLQWHYSERRADLLEVAGGVANEESVPTNQTGPPATDEEDDSADAPPSDETAE